MRRTDHHLNSGANIASRLPTFLRRNLYPIRCGREFGVHPSFAVQQARLLTPTHLSPIDRLSPIDWLFYLFLDFFIIFFFCVYTPYTTSSDPCAIVFTSSEPTATDVFVSMWFSIPHFLRNPFDFLGNFLCRRMVNHLLPLSFLQQKRIIVLIAAVVRCAFRRRTTFGILVKKGWERATWLIGLKRTCHVTHTHTHTTSLFHWLATKQQNRLLAIRSENDVTYPLYSDQIRFVSSSFNTRYYFSVKNSIRLNV